ILSSDLSRMTFQAGTESDTVQVRALDSSGAWSAWQAVHVNPGSSSGGGGSGGSVDVGFGGSGFGGFFGVTGLQTIDMLASQLTSIALLGGSAPGADAFSARPFDDLAWSGWRPID